MPTELVTIVDDQDKDSTNTPPNQLKINDDRSAEVSTRLSEDATNRTAFGETAVAQFAPQTGWIFAYNLNEAIVTKTEILGATVTHEGSFVKIESGTNPAAVGFIRTNRSVSYMPGIGALVKFTVIFGEPQENSIQLVGLGNAEDGWFFGYDGLKFGIMKRRNSIDEWDYQENWTKDTRPDLDPQKGNVYLIKAQWLGFGMQYFGVENEEGDIKLVHTIKYSNLNTDVSIANPSLPIAAGVGNSGNTTNIILKTPSAVGGLEGAGDQSAFEVLTAYEIVKTIPSGGVETYLFGLKNPDQYQGKENRLYVNPRLFSVASEGNKPVIFRVYFQPNITTPTWVDLAPDISPLQYDELGTWVKNGELKVFSLPVGKADNQIVDLSIIDANIQTNQIFAITAQSAGASDLVVSITFKSRS